MTSTEPTRSGAPHLQRTGPLVLAALAGVLHVVVGYFYLASGLLAPLWAVVLLGLWWIVLAWWLVRLARQRSWSTPVPPLVGILTWFAVMSIGEQLLGWTP